MKKLLSIFIVSFVIFFGVQVLAAEPEIDLESLFSDTSLQNGVDCFDYYKFQSVQVNVGPNKSAFTTVEDIDFSGKIINENRYPVFNGYVYVRIAEKNPGYIHEGHNIVDEFIALGPLAVDASSSIPVSFSWKVPENLKSGNYTANYFFSVNKKMNLGGLPFTNEIIVGFADFSIASTKIGNVSFIKSSTKVNNEKYNHIGNWPVINQGQKAVVTQVIQNTLKQDVETEISYNLYFWDSLDPKDLISTKKESVTLKAGESKILTYEIPKVELSAYYLQIVAKNENGTKSIVNIRVTSDSARPRINYFGLDNFPIQKGATTTLYSCFHNTSNISASGAVVLIAKDKMGKEISRVSYAGVIPSSISAEKSDFIAKTNLDYVKLEQKIYDDKNNLLDSQEIIYDASLIKEPETKAEPINPIVVSVLAGLIIFGFLLFTIRPIRKNKNLCLVIFSLVILIIGVFITFSIYFDDLLGIRKGSLTASIRDRNLGVSKSTLLKFQASQSGIENHQFIIGFWGKDRSKVFTGEASYAYTINTTAPSSVLSVGDEINFSLITSGQFNGTGGAWDSPYFGEKQSYNVKNKTEGFDLMLSMEAAKWAPFKESLPFKGDCVKNDHGSAQDDCIGGANGLWPNKKYFEDHRLFKNTLSNPPDFRYGYRKQLDTPKILSIQSGGKDTSIMVNAPFVENSSVLDCTTGVCRAVGVGTTTVKVLVGPSEVILGYSYPFPMRIFKEDLKGFRDSIPFEGFTATWEFEVQPDGVTPPTPPPPPGGCTENLYDTNPTWLTCDTSLGTQIGYFATTTVCAGATNSQPANTSRCCIDEYTYTPWICDSGTGIESRSATKTIDCSFVDTAPEDLIRSCPGYGSVNVPSSCIAKQDTSTKIFVNKQMNWSLVPVGITPVNATTEWSGSNILTTTSSSTVFNKIYTTVGLKTIHATSTWLDGTTVVTSSCSSSTNVIFGGGGTHEI